MRVLRTSLAAAALLIGAGCLPERELLPPDGSGVSDKVKMALRVELQTSTAGERVVAIQASYRRANGDPATLPVQPTQVTIGDAATVQQNVVIDIGPCNAAANSASAGETRQGCRFTIELTLKNGAGETLSSAQADVGPVGSGPTDPPTFVLSTPSLTIAPANLTFAARAQQGLPAAQTVSVNASINGATLGTISTLVAYTSGQGWLKTSIDQNAHTVSIQPTTTAMPVGTYSAIIGVSSSVDGMKGQTVPVTYQVSQPPVLAVTGGGSGAGTVTSSPAGISCNISGGAATGTCSAPFTPNAQVTLTEAPSGGNVFSGWGGACSGSGSCAVTLAQSLTVSATFNPPSPVLQLNPTSLSFSGLAGTSPPARQSVSIVNGGGGTLSGLSITSIKYGGSEPSWLDATISGTTISVGASPGQLQPGSYTASVVVGSSNGGSATLGVTFAVAAPPPILRLSPSTLQFSAVSGGASPARQPVAAVNGGGGTLAGINIVSITYGGSESPWLDATISGTTVSIGVSPSKLPAGTYTASVLVGSATGGNANLSVTFTVTAGPILQLSPTSVSFSGVSNGPNPPRQSVSIVNGGGGTLAGLAVSNVTYPGLPPSLWADATLTGTTLSVGAAPAKLPPGNYTATILIVSSNGGNATLNVGIAVAAPPPVLGLTPNALTFGALFGSAPPPAGQPVRASNISGGPFADLGTLSVGANTSSWLRVNIDGTSIVVTPTSTTVGRGTVTGVVTIISSKGGSATIAITYNLSFIG